MHFSLLCIIRGVARNLFWGCKSFLGEENRWIVILSSFLPHKKFTWADLGGINTHIPPWLRPVHNISTMLILSFDNNDNDGDDDTDDTSYFSILFQ